MLDSLVNFVRSLTMASIWFYYGLYYGLCSTMGSTRLYYGLCRGFLMAPIAGCYGRR